MANPFQAAAEAAVRDAAAAVVQGVDVSFADDIPEARAVKRRQIITPAQRRKLLEWCASTRLDGDQREVVESEVTGIHKVNANAGSGKTHTMIARAIYTIATTDVDPSQLVISTFTNRAAKEIKERYRAALVDVLGKNDIAPPYIGTIHGFSYVLVSRLEGFSHTVLAEGAGRSLLRRMFKNELFPDDKERQGEAFVRRVHAVLSELTANNELHLFAYPVWEGDKIVVMSHRDPRWTDALRARHRYPDQMARTVTMNLADTPLAEVPDVISGMDREYRADIRKHYADKAGVAEAELTMIAKNFMAIKYSNRTFEFGDLLYYPVAYLSQHPEKLKEAWEQWRFIFQDEAQDQDSLQYALLRLVAGPRPNLLLCADTKQTLYFWRFARPDLTDSLDRVNRPRIDFGAAVSEPQAVTSHYLRTNYRSKRQLVELANIFATGFRTRTSKPALAFREPAEGVLRVLLYETQQQENKAIAQMIAKAVASGSRKYSDFAVLTYTNRALLDLEGSFLAERVPYHLKHDGRSTTKQSTFRVLAAYYALSLNPRDVPALCEILEPVKGLGDKFLVKFQNHLNAVFQEDPAATVFTADLSGMADARNQGAVVRDLLGKLVGPFVKMVRQGQTRVTDLNLELRALYETLGCFEHDHTADFSHKPFGWQFTAEALRKVTRTLDQIYLTLMEDEDFLSLPEQHKVAQIHSILSLGSDDDDLEEEYTAPADKKDRVILATGHAFKGKQAKVVFVSNLNTLSPPKEDPEEEGKCWFYTAITRPEECLILTASDQVMDFKGTLRPAKANRELDDFRAAVAVFRGRANPSAA